MRIVQVVLCALVGFGVAAFALPKGKAVVEKYPIRLQPIRSPGDLIHITASRTMSTELTDANATTPSKQKRNKVELEGDEAIIEVDAAHCPTELQFTIDRFVSDGKTVLDRGTVVIAQLVQGKPKFAVKGRPLDPRKAQLFASFASPHRADEITDDAIFGTAAKQAVGDTWAINADLLAKMLGEGGRQRLTLSSAKGTVKLRGTGKLDGRDYLFVEAAFDSDRCEAKTPDGKSAGAGKINGQFVVSTAADGSGRRAVDSFDFTITMNVKGQTVKTEMASETKYGVAHGYGAS